MKVRSFVLRALTVALSVGLTLALVELALQVHNPLRSSVRQNRIVLNVNNRIEIPKRDGNGYTVYTSNSLGFRGPEPPSDFADRLTIVAIGGSTTEDIYLNNEDTWSLRLADELNPYFRDVWVNNAGISGHSTLGHIVLVRDHVRIQAPKVALFLIGVNDVGRTEEPEAVDGSYNFLYNTMNPSWRERANTAIRASELVNAAISLKRLWRATRLGVVYRPNYNLREAQHRQVSDDEIARRLDTVRKEFIPPYVRRLRVLIEHCVRAGIRPIFITQPALYGEGVDPVTGVRLDTIVTGNINGQVSNGLASAAVLGEYNRALVETAAQYSVSVLDLAAQLPSRNDLYLDLIHFNNAGSEKVAQIIASGLLPILDAEFPDFRR